MQIIDRILIDRDKKTIHRKIMYRGEQQMPSIDFDKKHMSGFTESVSPDQLVVIFENLGYEVTTYTLHQVLLSQRQILD